ncbi:MAG: FecR domain-containing protein [Pirellulaceae bacterium]|nr:FecR domain-containing protein [Pirellulaceae bacterium]
MCVLMLALVYETPPEPLALIARSRDCVGRLDDQPTTLFAGRNLFEKQRLSLDKGLVEIQFTDGASALIEGPASFEILGGNAGSLTRGRLAAVVPPEAHGFTVETPSVRVVDLGTEFGVLVDDDGRVEAHVFGGQVEVVLPGESADLHGETALLIQGEALHIAAADDKAKSSKIVRIPAAAERFTRSFTPPATAIARPEPAIVLPEPTILFAHRGSADPTTQGWKAHYRQFGEGLPRDGKKLGQLRLAVGPVDEARTEKGGTAAWRVCPLHDDKQVWYVIREGDELTPELRAEAREKGWVLRASVWISDKGPRADQGPNAPCYIVYRDEERSWRLWLLSDEDGNQLARIPEFDVAAVPSSRNQYVDYELRYHPVKKNAELFVNGRRVATHKGSPNGDATDKDDGAFSTIRFGTYRVPTEVRFAKIEWGILRDTEEK